MKKIRFYILFSEKLNRPFTSLNEFIDKRTFSLNLSEMSLFETTKDAQQEKDSILTYMNEDTQLSTKSRSYLSNHFKDNDFDIIKNLKIVEFRSYE